MEPNSVEYWVALLYSLLAVTALLGNIWVIVVVLDQVCTHYMPTPVNTRNMKAAVQSSATVYLLILSIVDLISVLPVPFLVIDIFRNEWPFGIVLCKLMFLCEGANKSLSPLLLTALSVDRYVAVCLPMLVSLRGAKFACFVLLLCFICSLFFIVPVLYHSEINGMLDAKMKLHSKCVVEMSQTFDLLQLLFCYVAPLLVICSVYVAILHRLYRHTRKNLAASASANSRTSISLSRVVKSSVLVVAFYFICWTPYWALRFFAMLQDGSESEALGSGIENPSISDNYNSSLTAVGFPETDDSEDRAQLNGLETHQVMLMYLVHALPYAQSAFNWLFYAFLNRNLRHSSIYGSTLRSSVFCYVFRSASATTVPYVRTPSIWRSTHYVHHNKPLSYDEYISDHGEHSNASCLKLWYDISFYVNRINKKF